MIIIGFTGKKGNGKSTASNKLKELAEKKGYIVYRINFKDALVETMKENLDGVLHKLGTHYNLTQQELFDQKPPIMRTLMQQIGTNIYRAMDDKIWVNLWEKEVSKQHHSKSLIIVDDIRFNNEYEKMKELGGVLYKVVATNKPDNGDVHVSEMEMDAFKCEMLVANSTEQLESLVENIAKELPHLP